MTTRIDNKGRVIWITGFAGAGKTTVARILQGRLQKAGSWPYLLDGDELREILGRREAYSRDERRELSYIYSRLCKSISDDGIDVICSTMALFQEVRSWNNNNITRYSEIYLRVPFSILVERRGHGVYEKYLATEDPEKAMLSEFEIPSSPDLIIDNVSAVTPELAAEQIQRFLDS